MSRLLAISLILAALAWIGSEMLELVLGGRVAISLWLTALFHALMVPGIWGAYSGLTSPRPAWLAVLTALVALGYLFMIVPPVLFATDPALDIAGVLDTMPAFKIAAFTIVIGTVLFGVVVLRSSAYPSWTGILLMVCPVVFAVAMLRDASPLLVIGVNLLQALAWLTLGCLVLRRDEQRAAAASAR